MTVLLMDSWMGTFANRFSSYSMCCIQGRVFGKYLHFSGISDPVPGSIQGTHQKPLHLNTLCKRRDNLLFYCISSEQSGSGQHLQLTSTRQLGQDVFSAILILGHGREYKTPPLLPFPGKLPH